MSGELGIMKVVDVGMIRRSVDVLSTRATASTTATSEEHPPAYDEWGDDSSFNYDSFRNDANGLGFELTEKYKPLSGTLTEEGNRWTDIRVENPEDKNTFVIVRRLDAVAFKGHPKSFHKSYENPIPQIDFSFNNGSASPIYVNKKGEDFAPVELDPFNTIVDVNWGGEDFVIISIIASANTSCQFDSEITFPKFTGMTVGNAGGGVTYNDCPAMTILCQGNVTQWDNGRKAHLNIPAKEVDPSIPYTYGLNIPAISTRNRMYLVYGVNPGINKAYETALNREYGSLLCVAHWGGKTITNADRAELFGQWGIPYGGAEGQVIDTSNDPYSPKTYWKLKGIIEHRPSQEGEGAGYISTYWMYKQMKTAYILRYDNQPYVYFSFFVGANVLKRALAAQISSQGGGAIEFDVKAGNAGVPNEENAVYANNGKIRATWYKGSVFKDALTMGSMQIGGSHSGGSHGQQYTVTNPATFNEAWAAMLDGTGYLPAEVVSRLSNAIVTSHEYSFACGSALLGAITGRAKFQLDFGGKSADRE